MTFKYEHLLNICYWCGCLDHSDKDCDRWLQSEETLKENDRAYGAWIRASFTSASRKAVVVVPGFYEDKKGKMLKSSKSVTRKHSSPVTGKWVDITKSGQVEETVTGDTEEQITDSLIAPKSLSIETAKGGNHGIKGDLLDK